MKTIRQKVIDRIKKQARKHFYAAEIPDHLDCGRHMADIIRGTNSVGHAKAYKNCVARLRRIDPTFPRITP